MADIWGLALQEDLNENELPVAALAVCKYMLPSGEIAFLLTTSEGMSDMEALGLLHAATIVQEESIKESWREPGEEED